MFLGLVGLGLVTLSFLLSALLCGLARRWRTRWGWWIGRAGTRGTCQPTPLGGGVAIWLTTVVVIGLGAAIAGAPARPCCPSRSRGTSAGSGALGELAEILGLATVIMLMGLVDDRKPLAWQLRLGIQVGLADGPGGVGGPGHAVLAVPHPLLGGAVTVLWIVGLTNAFNLLDNMDGLAASVGLIAALLFAGAQVAVGSLFVPAVLLVLVGALGGFLVHNRHPARLFMGDAGSNFLGFLLGTMTVAGTYYRYEPVVLAVQRAGAVAGDGGAALRHELGDPDPAPRGPEPVPGGPPALLAPAGRAWLDAAAGGPDD